MEDELEDQLLLPVEIQLNIFSFLKAKELNSLRLTSRRLNGVVNDNEHILYARRLLEVEVSFTPLLVLELWFRRSHYLIIFESGVCTRVSISSKGRDRWKLHQDSTRSSEASQQLRGLSLTQCVPIITARSGGIATLTLTGPRLYVDYLNAVKPMLPLSRKILVNCRNIALTKRVAFDNLFSVKRQFEINAYNPSKIICDDFCRDACVEELFIKLLPGQELRLTDEQLLLLVGRTDIDRLYIERVRGPGLQTIRQAVQVLLNSKMDCELSIDVNANEPEAVRMLRVKMGEESIEETANQLEHQIVYTIGKRKAVVHFEINNGIRLVASCVKRNASTDQLMLKEPITKILAGPCNIS